MFWKIELAVVRQNAQNAVYYTSESELGLLYLL